MSTKEEEILKQLISIPSVTGNEREVCEFVFELLRKEGFDAKKYPVDKKRFNIVANLGEDPKVYLQAHLDTVAPFIKFSEDKDFIYGRGACDTKGSAAAMISAAISCKQQGLNKFGLIFTVGEETTLDGAGSLARENLDIPFVIVGEPSSLEIVNAHFGLLDIKITAKGKASHSSRPEEGINAIDLLLETIRKVKLLEIHPETLISLVTIKGGVADNVIPAEASATFSFRVSPNDNNDYSKTINNLSSDRIFVEEIIGIKSVSAEVPKELDFIKERKTVKYFTELSVFKKGTVIGPGDIKHAHGPDDKVQKAELKKAVEVYSQIVRNFSPAD